VTAAAKPWVLDAPAKLNLFLRLVGRREDGYHHLESLIQILDWGDRLEFTPHPTLDVAANPPIDCPPEHNLVLRAARTLQTHSDCRQGARIHLHKRVPSGAGLGGGSSDAATTLLALNALWKLNLDLATLATLGLKLGADVPLFVRGYSALVRGIGERLTPLPLPARWFLVLVPNVRSLTADIFAHPDLQRDNPALFADLDTPLLTSPAAIRKIRARADRHAQNDCQAVVEQMHPPVAQARRMLTAVADGGRVGMTGTGCGLFAEFPEQGAAQQALHRLQERWAQQGEQPAQMRIAAGIDRSPVHAQLQRLQAGRG